MEEGKSENGSPGIKVMTDEQMEMLRKQISVYATICELLVQKHKEMSSKQDLTGVKLGNPLCDPFLPSGVHKIPSRHRWTPKQEQLEILEHIFEQCNATPGRQKIKEITTELAQHGQVSETNVYNWFQNRRARSKRKQQAVVSNIGEAEVDAKVEIAKDNMAKPEDIQPDDSSPLMINDMYIWSPEIGLDQLIGKMEPPESCNPSWQVEQYHMFGQ